MSRGSSVRFRACDRLELKCFNAVEICLTDLFVQLSSFEYLPSLIRQCGRGKGFPNGEFRVLFNLRPISFSYFQGIFTISTLHTFALRTR